MTVNPATEENIRLLLSMSRQKSYPKNDPKQANFHYFGLRKLCNRHL